MITMHRRLSIFGLFALVLAPLAAAGAAVLGLRSAAAGQVQRDS